jgi:hypothetical protein
MKFAPAEKGGSRFCIFAIPKTRAGLRLLGTAWYTRDRSSAGYRGSRAASTVLKNCSLAANEAERSRYPGKAGENYGVDRTAIADANMKAWCQIPRAVFYARTPLCNGVQFSFGTITAALKPCECGCRHISQPAEKSADPFTASELEPNFFMQSLARRDATVRIPDGSRPAAIVAPIFRCRHAVASGWTVQLRAP